MSPADESQTGKANGEARFGGSLPVSFSIETPCFDGGLVARSEMTPAVRGCTVARKPSLTFHELNLPRNRSPMWMP